MYGWPRTIGCQVCSMSPVVTSQIICHHTPPASWMLATTCMYATTSIYYVGASSTSVFMMCVFMMCVFMMCVFMMCVFMICMFMMCVFMMCVFMICMFMMCVSTITFTLLWYPIWVYMYLESTLTDLLCNNKSVGDYILSPHLYLFLSHTRTLYKYTMGRYKISLSLKFHL